MWAQAGAAAAGAVSKYRQNRKISNSSNPRYTNNVMEFLKRYWYVLVGIIVAFPYLIKYMREQERKDRSRATDEEIADLQNINKNPAALQEYLNQLTTNKTYQNEARDIYHHTGYAYPWYDPRSWTENDEAIFNILSKYNEIPFEITDCYFAISSGRIMRNDLQKVLRTSLYNQLNW